MNKVLKMDFRRQTAVLSAVFVLVGMMFLVPAITEKALATVRAVATGTCGPEGETHPCEFTLESKHLEGPRAFWIHEPQAYQGCSTCGVTWMTGGGFGDEKGSVTYSVGEGQQKETAELSFENPWSGSNKCSVSGIAEQTPCKAGQGHIADFKYNLRGK